MTVEDAIWAFAETREGLPTEAMQWALDHWDLAAPRFIELLEKFPQGTDLSEEAATTLFFVIHLLGEKGERRAYEPLCRFLLAGKESNRTLGDAITENLRGILINVSDGDPGPLTQVIESTSADEFARAMALEAMAYLAATERLPGFDMHRYLVKLVTSLQPQSQDYIWATWACAVAYLGYTDLIPLVEGLYREELIDPMWLGRDEFQALLDATRADPSGWAGLAKDHITPFGESIETLSQWYGFQTAEQKAAAEKALRLPSSGSMLTAKNTRKKVGRNDPCPCGSGKKFKKCCLGKKP